MKTIRRPCLRAALVLIAVLISDRCPLSSAHAATFTTNTVISESNTNYDGQDIIVPARRFVI